ncbi:unnamed protein product [Tetraodon nigroviridis]|uniref:(spotted green pufferfish) hypothetical protein n=1 Tax=Tetraodon nigroviridis TaxID=99883 RepID=Q4SU96_TETNG|nr:unnamed protein product [Tetraodon nigroviridis]
MDALLRAAASLLLGLLCSSAPPTFSYRVHIPPHDQVARVARFVAHQCDWASLATISTHKPVVGQPFSNVFSVSDGPPGSGSGAPYMYLTRMEISVQDLQVKPAFFFILDAFEPTNLDSTLGKQGLGLVLLVFYPVSKRCHR